MLFVLRALESFAHAEDLLKFYCCENSTNSRLLTRGPADIITLAGYSRHSNAHVLVSSSLVFLPPSSLLSRPAPFQLPLPLFLSSLLALLGNESYLPLSCLPPDTAFDCTVKPSNFCWRTKGSSATGLVLCPSLMPGSAGPGRQERRARVAVLDTEPEHRPECGSEWGTRSRSPLIHASFTLYLISTSQ